MTKKINQRTRITKRILKDSLIELLKSKTIYQISIRELCDKAEINRSTFYKYYGSQFDLLEEMEVDLMALVEEALSKSTRVNGHNRSAFQTICRYLEENLELSRLLINNNVDPVFAEKILGSDQVKKEIYKMLGPNYSERESEYAYNYITYGAYQVLRVWLNKDKRETPEEIVEIIMKQLYA